MSDIAQYVFIPLIPFVGWGVRHHLIRKDAYSPLKRKTLIIGIAAWMVTEFARSFYRPLIYANGVNDWHLADTVGNSAGTVTAIFIVLTLSGKGNGSDFKLVALIVAGLVGYEILSAGTGWAIDLWDIAATLCFGLLCAGIYYRLLARNGPVGHAPMNVTQ